MTDIHHVSNPDLFRRIATSLQDFSELLPSIKSGKSEPMRLAAQKLQAAADAHMTLAARLEAKESRDAREAEEAKVKA